MPKRGEWSANSLVMEEEAILSEGQLSPHSFWALLEKDIDEKNDELKSYKGQQYVYAKYDGQFSQIVYFDIRSEYISLSEQDVILEKIHILDDKDRQSPSFSETRYIISSLLLSVLGNESFENMRQHAPVNMKIPFKLVSSSKRNSVFLLHDQIIGKVEEYLRTNTKLKTERI